MKISTGTKRYEDINLKSNHLISTWFPERLKLRTCSIQLSITKKASIGLHRMQSEINKARRAGERAIDDAKKR